MPYIDDYNSKLKQTIRIQKDMLDAANKVIALQARQLDELIVKVHRYLGIDEEEAGVSESRGKG